jgi:hypothetical protein
MTDIYDQATEREERDREMAIAAAKRSAPALPYVGRCHNCDASLPESMRFCDADCCRDFEKRQRLSRL